jgi:hypothetical protein
MIIDISSLRSAVKSVLPLVSESYKGNGYGGFVIMDNSIWCVSGSFQSRFGGARVCDVDDGYEQVVDRYINLRDLHQFLSISFSSNGVNITSTAASLKVTVGIDTMLFRFKDDSSFGKFVSIPPSSGCLELTEYQSVLSVANAASESGAEIVTSGVFCEIGSIVQFVATDQFVTGYSSLFNTEHPPAVALIPANFLLYASRLYWESTPLFRIVDNKCWMFSSDFFVFSPVMASVDKFPGRSFFTELTKKRETASKVDTIALMDRLGAFVNIDYRGKNDVYAVSAVKFKFDDEKGMLVLSASTAGGSVEDGAVHVSYDGDGGEWLINVNTIKKIGNIMKSLLSSPSLTFSNHDRGWMVITPSNNTGIVFAIAPMSH